MTGKIFTVSKDDKTITLDVPPQMREEAPKQVEIKLTDKTHVIYENVGPAGATLTAGYAAGVVGRRFHGHGGAGGAVAAGRAGALTPPATGLGRARLRPSLGAEAARPEPRPPQIRQHQPAYV